MANPQVQLPGEAPLVPMNNQQQPVDNAIQQPQQPQIDTSDPINSLASMLVTPAEREAREQKMLQNKRRMIAWTGLFDGLRNLGNLYAVSKGASPMKFTDNPYQQIESDYKQARKDQDALYQNRDRYATQLYNIYRQGQQDKIREESHKAQMDWYNTRDEMARLKGENDRMKAAEQNRLIEARRKQVEEKTRQLQELHPLQKRKLEAVIKNTLHNANRPYGRSGGGSGSSSSDPFKELGQLLIDQPEVIGPILEQEGLGFYDKDTKEFQFTKNATKGMATTANRRAAGQGKGKRSTTTTTTNKRQSRIRI